jgi:hypothetical protein
MTGCRIGKVMLKAGGAPIFPLKAKDRNEDHRLLLTHASEVCDTFPAGSMAGFVVIGWGFDGSNSCGWKSHEESIIRNSLLPSYIADVIRRRLIAEGEWD